MRASFPVRLGDFGKTSVTIIENLFVEIKCEWIAQKKLADGLLDTRSTVLENNLHSNERFK